MAEIKNTIVWISRSPVQRNNILHQGNTSKRLQMELVRGIRGQIRGWVLWRETWSNSRNITVGCGVWDASGNCWGWESEALLHVCVCEVSPECKGEEPSAERFEVLSETCRVYGGDKIDEGTVGAESQGPCSTLGSSKSRENSGEKWSVLPHSAECAGSEIGELDWHSA